MPPQNQATPSQFPGEDTLLDTLRRSKVTDDQRQHIWDTYHSGGNEEEFVGALNKAGYPDEVKQTLYDMRFRGFKNQGNQEAPSPTAQQPQAGGASSISKPPNLGRFAGISAIGDAITPALKAFGSDIGGAILGAGEAISGLGRPGQGAAALASQLYQADQARKQAGYSPLYRGTAGVASLTGVVNPSGMEEEAAKGSTSGVLGHTILPLLGLIGGREAIKERSITEGPIRGGVSADSLPGLTRENAVKLQGMGFSNQEISTMNASELNSALAGSRKPTPEARPTEAVPGARASSNQSAAQPQTTQVSTVPTKAPEPTKAGPGGDLRGTKGPLRPYDPSGNRFATGGTVGMDPLDLMAPKPNVPQGSARPQVDPITGVTKGTELTRPPATTIKGPSTVPGTDPLQMMLENRALFQTKPPSPYIASEKAATMSAPRPSLGPEFELGQVKHEIDRNRAIIESDTASPEDKRIAQSRAQEGLFVQATPPINRGSQAGVTQPDAYYKPAPPPLVPSSEVEAPAPQPVEPIQRTIVPRSHELPNEVQSGLDMMMSTKKLVDTAKTPEAKAAAQNLWDRVATATKLRLKDHFAALTPEQLVQLRGDQEAEGSRHEQQAGVINDIVAGDKLAKAMRTEMRGEKAMSARGQAFVVPGTTTHADLRSAIHDILGDKTALHFDEVAVNQRAKARDQGLDPDTIQPEGYRRVAPEEFNSIRLGAKTELQQLQDNFKTRLKNIVNDRLEKNPSLVQEQGEDAAKNIHAQALKELLAEKNDKNLTLAEQIKELRDLIGRDPQRPIYTKKGEPIVTAEGVVKAPGDIPAKSLAVARRIWGKQLNKIPDDAAWQKKADEHLERGRLAKAIAKGIDAFLKVRPPKGKEGEAGVIGEATPPTKLGRSSVTSKDLDPIKMLAAAKKGGFDGHQVTDEHPAGEEGWLSPDGGVWIDKGSYDHADVSDVILPGHRNPMYGMLENGWVRKAMTGAYEVWNLNTRAVDTIEMDLIRNRATNKPTLIDTRTTLGIKPISIPPGWEDLGKAVSQAKREAGFTPESGKIGGTDLMAGMAAGGLAGAVAGGIHGGVAGMVVGGTVGLSLGFITPAILSSRAVGQAMKSIASTIRGAGLSLKTWFQGTPQVQVQGDPDMDSILREQQAHADRSIKWMERAKQLPAEIYKGYDPFAYVADKKNMGMIGRTLMSFDPQGRVFRDLTVPDTQSLYMALANAGGDALGQRRSQNTTYNEIRTDANKAGLREALDRYLNYKAYARTNEVLQEHIQSLDSQIQNIQTKLQSPSNTIRQTVALQDDLKDTQKMRKEIQDKIDQGKATPKGYTSQKIQASLSQMEQFLGPDKYAQVEALAQRAFKSREHILDMLFDSGIISQDAYTQYKSRGPEYVPMERIMDDLENNRFSSSASPLHLRHQTVIQTMEGSTRTNVNPWEAFDHADRKAFNQLYRNDAMKSALDLAKANPNTIGQEFVPVKADYQPKAGEMILGHYQNGNPNLFAVPKYLGETMQQVPLAMKNGLAVFANWYGHLFKKAATIGSTGFQISSALTHALSGMMLAPHGAAPLPTEVAKFINDWRKAAKDVINNGQFVRELTRYGGASGSFQTKVDPEYFANPSELGFRGKLAKCQILDAAQDLALGIENINRTNIFMRARQAGLTAKAAAWEAKQFAGMPDFSRMGDISRPLNHVFMFFNAANQYLAQATAAIRKNPERVFGWMATMTAMGLALSAWNMQQVDTKGNNLLRKETTFDRQRNWIIELPWTYHTHAGAEKGHTVKIPKPYIARLLNPIEDVVNYGFGKESRTGKQQALDSMASVSPIHLNLKADQLGKSALQSGISALHPLAKFGIQQYSNIDDFGRPIVPPSQQGIEPGLQEGPYTSSVASQMGQGGVKGAIAGGSLGATLGSMAGYPGVAIGGVAGAGLGSMGISPRRTDVGVRTLTAGVGQQAESILDPFFGGAESRKQLSGMEKFRTTPIIGSVVSRFTTSPSDAEFEGLSDRFYTAFQQAETIKKTSDYLLQQGKGQEAAKYIQDHRNELHQAMVLGNLLEPIKEISKLIREIQGSSAANSEAGRRALETAYETRMNLLRAAKNMLDAVPSKASDTGPMANPISNSGSNK